MKKVARLRMPQDEFVPPHKASIDSNVGVRTTGRIKKPKAVFDPSDNYVPRAQRLPQVVVPQQQHVTSPKSATNLSPSTAASREKQQRERSLSTGSNISNNSNSQETDICMVCQKREPRRGGNYRNKLMTCIGCSQKVHRLCITTDFLESAPVRLNYKCESCRTCEICEANEQNSKGNGEILTCAKCVTFYHAGCLTPKATKYQQNQRNWKCCKCAPNATSAAATAAASNSNANKEEPLPVTVIRQIIGYDANMQPLPKAQTHTLASTTQPLQKTEQLSKEPLKESTKQQMPQIKQESTNEAEMLKLEALSRSHSEISSSSSIMSSASEDEDYKYVEKKKRKLLPESNNGNGFCNKNNGNDHANGNSNCNPDVDMENDLTDKKQLLQKANFDELPKREVIRTWSVEKLTNYVGKFFPNEAQVFKEHEIDGNALLLLKRSDVVKKLPLKLGPSLRLYNFILKIQTQKSNDPTLGWDCSVDTLMSSTE